MSKMKIQLVKQVDKLLQISKKIDNNQALNSINSFKEEVKSDLTYSVTVLGEFSSGKSSMINKVFLNENILPEKSTPTTAILTTIRYGKEKLLKIHFKDGTTQKYKDNFSENLLKNVSTDSNGKNPEKVKEAELFWPSDILSEGVIIVDTPGLNDPNKNRENITMQYLDKTDSIIYLTNSTQPWSQSVKEFVEENIFTKERAKKLFILLNYWDMVPEQERDEVYSYVKNQLHNSIEYISKREEIEKIDIHDLIPISCKTDNIYGLDKFKKNLWDFLITIKGNQILEQKYDKFDRLKKSVIKTLNEKSEIQSKKTEEINLKITELENEALKFKQSVDQYKKRIKPQINIFFKELENELDEYYTNIQKIIIKRITLDIHTEKNVNGINQLIKRSIIRSFSMNENKLNKILNNLYKKIDEFSIAQKATFNLNNDFSRNIKHDIDTKIYDELKETEAEYKLDNNMLYYTSIGSITAAALSALILPPLALIGVAGFIYYGVKLEPEEFENNIDNILEKIEDRIREIIKKNKENIENITNDNINDIINSISNDITETYKEKDKLYKEALKNREQNIENEIIKKITNHINEIKNI